MSRAVAISALPSVLMLTLFYSLAMHMRYALGAWPASIGDNGFSSALRFHDALVVNYVVVLVLLTMALVPAGFLVCLLTPGLKRGAVYFASYAVFYGVAWLLMLLAPAPFLNWWWD